MNIFEKLYFFKYIDALNGSNNDEVRQVQQAVFATPKAEAIISQYNATITKNQEAIEKEYRDFQKKHPKHSQEQEQKFFKDMFEKQFIEANDTFLETNKDNYWVKNGNLILTESEQKLFDSLNKVVGGIRWFDKFKSSEMFKDGGGVNRWFSNDNLSESYKIKQPNGTIQDYYYSYPKDFLFGSFGADERTKIVQLFNLVAPLQNFDDWWDKSFSSKGNSQKEAIRKVFERYTNDQNRNFIEAFDKIAKEYSIDFIKNDNANTKLNAYVNRGVLIGLENVMTDKKINQSGFSNQSITSSPYYYHERKKLLDSLGEQDYNRLVKNIKDALAKHVKESSNKEAFETRNKMALLLAIEKDPKILYRLDPRFFDDSDQHSFQIGHFFNRSAFKDVHVENDNYIALKKQFQKDKEELEDNGNANASNNKLAKQHQTQIIKTDLGNRTFTLELNATVDNADSFAQNGLNIRRFEDATMRLTEQKTVNGEKVNVVIEPDYKTPLNKALFKNAIASNHSTLPKDLLNTMRKEYKDAIPTPNDLKQQGIKYSIFSNHLDAYNLKDPKTVHGIFEKNGVHTVGDLLKQFQADPFFTMKNINPDLVFGNLKLKKSTSGVNSFTPISLVLAKQMQSALLVEQYKRLIYDEAKKELPKNQNKTLDQAADGIYHRSGLFQWSNKNMEYKQIANALLEHFRHTDKKKIQNVGALSEIIDGFKERDAVSRATTGSKYFIDPNAINPYMPTLFAHKTGELKNLFGDLAAYETNKGDGLTLTVTPKRLANKNQTAPKYEKKQYIVGSAFHDLSKNLENSVVELDQKEYGSPESLHTIGGSPKSELMLALAHLSKSLSIDNQDPNAPLSDLLKKRLDDAILEKATFRTFSCMNDQYVEFDRTPGVKFDISDKMLDETLSCYSKPIADYIKQRKRDFRKKVPGDPDFEEEKAMQKKS